MIATGYDLKPRLRPVSCPDLKNKTGSRVACFHTDPFNSIPGYLGDQFTGKARQISRPSLFDSRIMCVGMEAGWIGDALASALDS